VNHLIDAARILCGSVLLLLHLTDVVSEVPYSVFAVLLGAGLVVDAVRNIVAKRS